LFIVNSTSGNSSQDACGYFSHEGYGPRIAYLVSRYTLDAGPNLSWVTLCTMTSKRKYNITPLFIDKTTKCARKQQQWLTNCSPISWGVRVLGRASGHQMQDQLLHLQARNDSQLTSSLMNKFNENQFHIRSHLCRFLLECWQKIVMQVASLVNYEKRENQL